jgi:hypothetical protein
VTVRATSSGLFDRAQLKDIFIVKRVVVAIALPNPAKWAVLGAARLESAAAGCPEVLLWEVWVAKPLAHNSCGWRAGRLASRRRDPRRLSGCGSRLDDFLDLP